MEYIIWEDISTWPIGIMNDILAEGQNIFPTVIDWNFISGTETKSLTHPPYDYETMKVSHAYIKRRLLVVNLLDVLENANIDDNIEAIAEYCY